DHEAREAERPVSMSKPSLLPYGVLGMVCKHLDTPLRHLAGFDARDREGRSRAAGRGRDRARKRSRRTHMKAGVGQPAVRLGGVGNRKSRELDAGIAAEAGV